MFRSFAEVRTVWVKDLVTEKRQGPNGEFDAKSILFRVATRRNYTRTVMKDGQQVEEYVPDFMLCRANGGLAQLVADNCSAVDANGKHVSRHLNIYGHIETYTSDRTFKIENLPLNIQNFGTVNVSFDTVQKVDGHIFIVDEIEFLDPKPQPKVQTGQTTVTNVQVATAQIQPVQNAVVPQANNVAPASVPSAIPVAQTAQVATPVATPVAQNPLAGAMNPPTVPEGYTGEPSPF